MQPSSESAVQPTVQPTVIPTTEQTQGVPAAQPAETPLAKTLIPFFGILAGFGYTAVLIGLRRK
ncbi:MAG: hypothetical protein Q4Q20_04100 [Methanocorpusculum sp.]|nr:hypothetical protein [Methanocorpusculum sp.]